MKTRRSLLLQKNGSEDSSMQTVLFPNSKKYNSKIVPESPENFSLASISTCAASVLETPDEVDFETKKLKKFMPDAIESSFIADSPTKRLTRRTNVLSILESDYNYGKLIKSLNNNGSLPRSEDKRSSCGKNAINVIGNKDHFKYDPILPFDLNNEEEMARRLSISQNSRKKLKSNSSEGTGSTNGYSKINGNIDSNKKNKEGNTKRNSNSFQNTLPNGKSVLSSTNYENVKTTNTNQRSRKSLRKSVNSNHITPRDRRKTTLGNNTILFENSELDLTDANCGESQILLKTPLSLAPLLEHSVCYEDEVFFTSSNNNSKMDLDGEIYQSQKKMNGMTLKAVAGDSAAEENLPHTTPKNNSIYLEPSTPTFDKYFNGELSPLNRHLLQSQSSFSPTQPASILVLKGVTTYVDVRSGADNRSGVIKEALKALGAEVSEKFTAAVTHVIFRDGSKNTYLRAMQRGVQLVSPLWVDSCRIKLVRVSESLFPISTDYMEKNPILGNAAIPRKLKSMQPREFEEDEFFAEARVRRRQRTITNSISESFSPVVDVRTPSENINSPMFGIGHLLTPNREQNVSTSTVSTEKSSSEKELKTPLATRMFNKYNQILISQLNSQSPYSNKKLETPLRITSNRYSINSGKISPGTPENLLVKAIGLDQPEKMNEFCSNDTKAVQPENLNVDKLRLSSSEEDEANTNSSNIAKNWGNTHSREASLDGDADHCNKELVSKNNNIEVQNLLSPSQNKNPVPKKCNGIVFKRKSILKSSESSGFRRSKRLSVAYKDGNIKRSNDESLIKNKMCADDIITSNDTNTYRSENSLNHETLGSATYENAKSQTSTSIASATSRKRRLHTVDNASILAEELIVPSTPPVSERCLSQLYENLHVKDSKTKKKGVKKRGATDIHGLPNPRKVKSLSSETDQPNSFNSSSDKSVLTKTESLKTPKGRFSLIGKGRNSLEDFRTPNQNLRQKVLFKKKGPKETLPSICFTSVHSRDLGGLFAIVKKLGRFRVIKDVDRSTTHVICGSERRTLNVLIGTAFGCWILDVSWLYESIEMSTWAPEEPFELFNFCPGAKISRICKENNENFHPSLFEGLGRIHVSDSSFPAPCIIQAVLVQKYLGHLAIHRVFPCPFCSTVFKRKDIKTHIAEAHQEEVHYPCSECDQIFDTFMQLRRHCLVIHMGVEVERTQCTLCNKTFSSTNALRVHLETIHAKAQVYGCPVCKESFNQRGNMQNHYRRVHQGVEARKLQCDICRKGFICPSDLRKHVERVHLKIRKNEVFCKVCAKPFSDSRALKIHMNAIHTKEVQYPCPECNMVFHSLTNMVTHRRRMHSGNEARKHICEVCNKGFCSPSDLRTHVKVVHENVRKFICDICGQSFKVGSHLKYHRRKHTGETPYKCPHCGKSFRGPSHISDHIKKVHKTVYMGVNQRRRLNIPENAPPPPPGILSSTRDQKARTSAVNNVQISSTTLVPAQVVIPPTQSQQPSVATLSTMQHIHHNMVPFATQTNHMIPSSTMMDSHGITHNPYANVQFDQTNTQSPMPMVVRLLHDMQY